MVQMYSYPAVVRRVIDADSLVLDIDLGFGVTLTRQKVRLKDINAPEMNTIEGRIAKQWLEDCLNGYLNKIFIVSYKAETTRSPEKVGVKGKWGRWVVDCYTEDLHINKVLLEQGHAVPYQ